MYLSNGILVYFGSSLLYSQSIRDLIFIYLYYFFEYTANIIALNEKKQKMNKSKLNQKLLKLKIRDKIARLF